MKIFNTRYGFATNSSSSHSIVYMSDERLKSISEDWGGDSFGWENFTLITPEFKLKYLAQTLFENLLPRMNEDLAQPIVKDWCDGVQCDESIIDHESLYTLPYAKPLSRTNEGYVSLDREFFEDFKTYILNPNTVILGGNDNSEGHPLSGMGVPFKDILQESFYTPFSRKDGDWWTLFEPHTGYRHTFSFNPNAVEPDKFDTPFLVDLKITNACDKNCHFCYQDSTPEGAHASCNLIHSIAYHLSEMDVFEVAIGGGEPTKHPDFSKILKTFHDHYIVPNFTTKSLDWVENEAILTSVKDCVGGVAFSAEAPEDIRLFAETMKTVFPDKFRRYGSFVIHLIPELMPENHLKTMLCEAKKSFVSVTLLGLKNTGRGAGLKAINPLWAQTVLELKKEFNCPSLAVDTDLARRYPEDIASINPNRKMWYTDEGSKSMYIDAVTSRVAPSSYSKPEAFLSMKGQSLQDLFEKLAVES